MTYSYKDLLKTYNELGVAPGKIVYATSDLWNVAGYKTPGGRALVKAHVDALLEALGPTGTLVVSTGTENICGSDTLWDPKTSKSFLRGALSEYVRQMDGAKRSFQPFHSYAAIGRRAADITEDVSRNSFGADTPEERMINLDALSVCIGVEPRITCSAIHHVEQVVGVPYRYMKEFIHPVVRDGNVKHEPFYKLVWYREMDMVRDRNRKIFASFDGELDIKQAPLGGGAVYSYPVSDFYKLAVKAMVKDIYIWLDQPPEKRPYQL
jgi:aminoglycoside 3-N-acetyltransferase